MHFEFWDNLPLVVFCVLACAVPLHSTGRSVAQLKTQNSQQYNLDSSCEEQSQCLQIQQVCATDQFIFPTSDSCTVFNQLFS